jgi:GNAT superfamily N-acetyltransferase
VLVRDRTEDDLGPCLEIARAVKAQDNYPPLGSIDIEWFLRPAEQQAAWVAAEHTSVVGHVALHSAVDYVSTRLASDYLERPQSELGVVSRLYVDPARRGAGVGHALLDHVTTAALEQGLHPVLDVATHLDGAVALYEAVGWKRIGDVVLSAWDTAPIEPPLALFVYVAP